MPAVTVIIPVFNGAAYLRQCLTTVLGQTLEDLEVICVDDGSTDSSVEILDEYAREDSRLRVMHQGNAGAGAARNAALAVARGTYLSFLDADDFFEPTMLAEALGRATAEESDIVIFGARTYDDAGGGFGSGRWMLKTELLPAVSPFSRVDMPDHILDFVNPAPWNKLFRRQFIVDAGLRFQEIKRANDLYFMRMALVRAGRISVIDKELATYRRGTTSSLQATNHETPTEFYAALSALHLTLVQTGELELVERSYFNEALSHCLYNLNSLKTADTFVQLYNKLRDEYFEQLGITEHDEEYFYSQRQYQQYVRITQLTAEEYLLARCRDLRAQIDDERIRLEKANAKLRKWDRRLTSLTRSRAYRISRRFAGSDGGAAALELAASIDQHRGRFEELATRCLPELGIADAIAGADRAHRYDALTRTTPEESLFGEARELAGALEDVRARRKDVSQAATQSKQTVRAIEGSGSYRFGRLLARIERAMRRFIPARPKAG